MTIGRLTLPLLLTFLWYAPASAQRAANRIPGELLVSLRDDANPLILAQRFAETVPGATLAPAPRVSELLNIWLFRCDTLEVAEQTALHWLLAQPEVRLAQRNHWLDHRAAPPSAIFPNDPLFPLQWQYQNSGANGGTANADLDAELAWDIATGGLTPAGDTIVVAVIDAGVEANHPDLVANRRINWAEIPGDGIDNDANGYVDDVRGWNVYANNDDITGAGAGHGTPVCGIVGARGDNSTGVAGVNWQVKILFVAGSGQESNILSAYDYVLRARRRYNATNGQQGAFVVAVNCSWGINYGQPADAPLWCAAFDSLGAAGILSVAATANLPIDVDQAGDLPTGCTSGFLVSVTNLNNADQLAPDAAWGAQSVDLGAYGQDVFTLSAGGGYGLHAGTSFAAPHVSGAIALLYAAPCPNLIALTKTNPAAAALWAKSLLLAGTTPNGPLEGITVTGGRLNLYQLLNEYETQCSDCPPPFALHAGAITTGEAMLQWVEIDDFQSVHLRWREVGEALWNYVADAQSPFFLDNLQICADYEFAVYATCSGGLSSAWSEHFSFQTDGCCLPPAAVWSSGITTSGAEVNWSAVTAAAGYRLRLRPAAGGAWSWYDVDTVGAISLANLLPCTDYEVQIQTRCDTLNPTFSPPYFFKTAGCGACTDAQYCPAGASWAGQEWIAGLQIGAWEHWSGGGAGYQDFTGSMPDVPVFAPFAALPVIVTPGYAGLPYKEYCRIFVDFNADGDFDDAGELAFNPGFAIDGPMTGWLETPGYTASGLTRLRVVMKYQGMQDSLPGPCESFAYGQVEDYCVLLSDGALPSDGLLRAAAAVRVFPQPATSSVWLEMPDFPNKEVELTIWSAAGKLMTQGNWPVENSRCHLDLTHWPTGIYVANIRYANQSFPTRIIKI